MIFGKRKRSVFETEPVKAEKKKEKKSDNCHEIIVRAIDNGYTISFMMDDYDKNEEVFVKNLDDISKELKSKIQG